MTSTCFVRAADFVRFWKAGAPRNRRRDDLDRAHERRVGVPDRRARGHERRWRACEGRRFGVSDRRRRATP